MSNERSTNDLESHADDPAEMQALGVSLGIDLRSISADGVNVLIRLRERLGAKQNPLGEWLDGLLHDEMLRLRSEDSDTPLENSLPLYVPSLLTDVECAQAMQVAMFFAWIVTHDVSAVRFCRKLATMLSADLVSRAKYAANSLGV